MNEKLSFKDIFVRGAVVFNPVLVQLAGLCPVVAASTNLASSLMLSAVACIDLVAVCVIASAFLRNVPRWIRVALYFIIGTVLICPLLWYIESKTLATLSLSMKIYIPLIAINSVVAVHSERVAVKNSVKGAALNAVAVGMGASAVFIIVGAVRELLGSATIGGLAVNMPVTFKGMTLPFGCLVLLGFMAAMLKAFISKKYPDIKEEKPVREQAATLPEPEEIKEPEETAEPVCKEEIQITEEAEETDVQDDGQLKIRTEEEIDEFLKSLGIDLTETEGEK